MKKSIVLILLLLSTLKIMAQLTEQPSFRKAKPWWIDDVRVNFVITLRDKTDILVYISGSYAFNEKTYLEYQSPVTGNVEKLFLRESQRMYNERALQLARYGYHVILLEFPPLPEGVTKIDLISKRPKVFGISIKQVDYEEGDMLYLKYQ